MTTRRQAVPNEQVSLSAIEVGLHVRLVQLDREVTMRSRKISQVRREETRNPLAGGQAHHAAGVIPEGHPATVDGGGGVGHALCHRQQVLAPLRQPMTIRRALEEARGQALLELTQVPDDCRLAEAERPRGPPQAAGLSDGEKDAQVVPLHAVSLATSTGWTCFESGAG